MAGLKSLMLLWKELAKELASWCSTSTTLDYQKLKSRVEHEGLSFLAITLPAFGKDFERCLDLGKVDPGAFPGFARKGGLPLFLGGFLDRVFDRSSGVLLDSPCVDSIFAVRQLTLMFKKIRRDCSQERIDDALRAYIKCEQELKERQEIDSSGLYKESSFKGNLGVRPFESDYVEFRRIGALIFGDVFTEIDRLVYRGELVPKHGPGATADRLLGNEKYVQRVWHSRLEGLFPYLENVLPGPSYWKEVQSVQFLEPGAEPPVRVVTVPKTLKTPRIIAIEPTCQQFMQQAILEAFVKNLEAKSVAENSRDNLAESFVGFTDQNPNREMARKGSRDGSLATLDMSEASDRVSNEHVINLLTRWPHLGEALQVTRSTKAHISRFNETIVLSKFASMGSAVCFPVEAIVFTTVVFMGIQNWLNTHLTRKDISSFRGKVRVYGDDIVVPVDSVGSVIASLEAFGFKVNNAKSFWTGKFRESCGGDYYDGHDVSVVYVKDVFPSSPKYAEEVISTVAFRNLLYLRGLWRTCRYLDRKLIGLLGHYPVISERSPLLGRLSFLPPQGERISRHTHTPISYGWVESSTSPSSPLGDVYALMKFFLKRGDEPYSKEHLQRAGRPRVVNIKLAWRGVA